jgi:hypothetical protein
MQCLLCFQFSVQSVISHVSVKGGGINGQTDLTRHFLVWFHTQLKTCLREKPLSNIMKYIIVFPPINWEIGVIKKFISSDVFRCQPCEDIIIYNNSKWYPE